MTIDYKMLTTMLSSSHAAEAVRAIVQEAERVGFGSTVNAALEKAVTDALAAERTLQQEELRQAFLRLEWRGKGRHRESYEGFAAYVNAVSRLADRRDAIADGEAFLLSARDENGEFIVSNPRVLDHIRKVGGTIDRMATRYLSDPGAWSQTVARASEDVGMMVEVLRSTVPGEFENPYHRFHALTLRAQELAIAARATEARGGDEARAIEALSFAINGALEEGRFHDVIQLALEVWVRSVELLDPSSEVEQESRAAAKIRGIREGAPSAPQPATVPTPVNTGAIPTGTTITTALALGAIHPCTRVLK